MEELIDTLDVAQEDPRSPTSTRSGISRPSRPWTNSRSWRSSRASRAARRPGRRRRRALTGEPLVAVLESDEPVAGQGRRRSACPDPRVPRLYRCRCRRIPARSRPTRSAHRRARRQRDPGGTGPGQRGRPGLLLHRRTQSACRPARGPRFPSRQPAGNPLHQAPIVVSESTQRPAGQGDARTACPHRRDPPVHRPLHPGRAVDAIRCTRWRVPRRITWRVCWSG